MNIERNDGRQSRLAIAQRASHSVPHVPSIVGRDDPSLAIIAARASTGPVPGLRSCR